MTKFHTPAVGWTRKYSVLFYWCVLCCVLYLEIFLQLFLSIFLVRLLPSTFFLCAWKRNRKRRGNVMILPPSDPFFMFFIPCLPHNALHFTFGAAILLLATLFAYLGSCAYPILSHLLLCRFPLRLPL